MSTMGNPMSNSNRYRQRVERIDARRRWLIQWTAFGFSTVLGAVVLLNAGVDPSRWYVWLKQQVWSPAPSAAAAVGRSAPRAVLPTRIPATSTKLPGNNSSVSAIPQRLILTGTLPGRNFKEGSAMLG